MPYKTHNKRRSLPKTDWLLLRHLYESGIGCVSPHTGTRKLSEGGFILLSEGGMVELTEKGMKELGNG